MLGAMSVMSQPQKPKQHPIPVVWNSAPRRILGLTLACSHGRGSLEAALHGGNAPPNTAYTGSEIADTIFLLLLLLYALGPHPCRFGGRGPVLLCDSSRELDLLEKSVALRGKLPQGVLEILVAEPCSYLHTLDSRAASVAGGGFGFCAKDGACGHAVVGTQAPRRSPGGVAIDDRETVLRLWTNGVGLESAVFFNCLIDIERRRRRQAGRGDGAEGGRLRLRTLVVDLRGLDAGYEKIVGERRGDIWGRGSGSHCRCYDM